MPGGVPDIVDVIILSYTKTQELYDMTFNCIRTLMESEKKYIFNVVLVETDKEHEWEWQKGVTSIQCDLPFNYNQALNKGLRTLQDTSATRVVIANNDVLFTPGWYTHIAKAMSQWNLNSASPRSLAWQPHQHYTDVNIDFGFRTSYQFCGWCLVFNWDDLKKVLPLDESFEFEWQDNDLARQLENKGYKHALIARSRIVHLLNRSHPLLTEDEHTRMITKAREVFDDKYK